MVGCLRPLEDSVSADAKEYERRVGSIEDAEFTVANSASVENVLKETYQGEDMTERKRSYERPLLNWLIASMSAKAKGGSNAEESDSSSSSSSSSSEAMWYTIECSEMRENAAGRTV